MLNFFKRNRADGGTEHQETVNSRVRGLTSVAHDLTDDAIAEEIRQKLNGGRSEFASRGRTQ